MSTKENVAELMKFGNDSELLFPSRYLKACDLGGRDATVIIESITPREELQMTGGRKEKKPIISFKGKSKTLVLNKTNMRTIAKIYGSELTAWLDRPITLYPTKTTFGGSEVPAIRIRVTKPADPKPDKHDPVTGEVEESTDKPQREPGE